MTFATSAKLRTLVAVLALTVALLPGPLRPQLVSDAAGEGRIGKVRWAYYVPYASDSLDSLQQNIDVLNYLSPYWYHLDGEGNLTTYGGASAVDKNWDVIIKLARSKGVKILPMIKNSVTYAAFHPVLAEPDLRKKTIDQIVRMAVDNGFDGAHIDFEGLNGEDRPYLTVFMGELASKLRSAGKLVTQAVPAKEKDSATGWAGAYDYAALAPSNDLIVLMTYGYGVSIPQSTAPYPWVEGSVRFAASLIPPEKLLLGLALYGFDWNLTSGKVTALRDADIVATVRDHKVEVQYDERAQSPHYKYTEGGDNHEAWYEDFRSNGVKMNLVFQYGLAGAAAWRMGQEGSRVWDLYRDRLGYRTWYLAEGSSGQPYHTWILIQNPNPYIVISKVTFMKEDGSTVVREYDLKPSSRFSIFANDVVPNTAFSTKIEAMAPVFVERAMYFGYDGHDDTGINAPSRRWYLPEGNTNGTHTWVLLMNPNAAPAQTTLTFMTEQGDTVVKQFTIKPTARLNVFTNLYFPDSSFSTLVEADQPIVAESASYFSGGKAGYNGRGSDFAAARWYMAEGFTGHTVSLAIMNPNPVPAKGEVTFMVQGGQNVTQAMELLPHSRRTVVANQVLPKDVSFSATVTADVPVVVQRTSILPSGEGGHSALGVPAPAKTWFLAEGSTANPFQEYLALQNPSGAATRAVVTFMTDTGQNVVREYSLAAQSRATIDVNAVVPGTALSVRVDGDAPIVVERTMYFSRGGTSSPGVSQ